jgi:hypothetical protein
LRSGSGSHYWCWLTSWSGETDSAIESENKKVVFTSKCVASPGITTFITQVPAVVAEIDVGVVGLSKLATRGSTRRIQSSR